jgi:ketosteroid isomerase-like protein
MDRADMDRMVDEHFDYEAHDDIEGVLRTFTDDVVHHVTGSPYGEVTGKAAVRAFYEELFAAIKGEHVTPVARWYGADFLVDETRWTGRIEDGRLFGQPGGSGQLTFRLLHVFEFRDGLIRTEKVWSDTVAIADHLT